MNVNQKLEGEVIFWKGTYGFIRHETEDGITTYFAHFKNSTNINSEQEPVIGSRASFDIAKWFKPGMAPEAVNVRFSEVRPKNSTAAVSASQEVK